MKLKRLSKPAKLNQYVQPVSLPRHCAPLEFECDVSAWGQTSLFKNGSLPINYSDSRSIPHPDKLRLVQLVINDKRCEDTYGSLFTRRMTCLDHQVGKSYIGDPCTGDAGGPVVCKGEIQGIVSWGSGQCGADNRPSVYTRVCAFNDWIRKTMSTN